jgi:hypothetical protein
VSDELKRIAEALERIAAALAAKDPPPDPVLSRGVGEFFEGRALNRLIDPYHPMDAPITTIGELVGKTAKELGRRRGFGKGSVRVVRNVLAGLGLKLRGD